MLLIKEDIPKMNETDKVANQVDRVRRKKHLICTICGLKCSCNSQLVVHMRVHTGEKPHCCPRCKRAFKRRYDLNLHVLTHTDDNEEYSCKNCGKIFKSVLLYKQHTVLIECKKGDPEKQLAALTDQQTTTENANAHSSTQMEKMDHSEKNELFVTLGDEHCFPKKDTHSQQTSRVSKTGHWTKHKSFSGTENQAEKLCDKRPSKDQVNKDVNKLVEKSQNEQNDDFVHEELERPDAGISYTKICNKNEIQLMIDSQQMNEENKNGDCKKNVTKLDDYQYEEYVKTEETKQVNRSPKQVTKNQSTLVQNADHDNKQQKRKRTKRKTSNNCKICGQSCPTLSHLEIHMRIHTGERPYCCTFCGKAFKRHFDVKRHMLIHRSNAGSCQEISAVQGYWTKNKRLVETQNLRKETQDKSSLKLHVNKDVDKQGQSFQINQNKKVVVDSVQKGDVIQDECISDTSSFVLREKLRITENRQMNKGEEKGKDQSKVAEDCDQHSEESSEGEESLQTEVIDKHLCHKQYEHGVSEKQTALLKTVHQNKRQKAKIRNSKKSNACKVCGHNCLSASQLVKHMHVHTGERPYSCTLCGQGFTRIHGLKRHKLSYSGKAGLCQDISPRSPNWKSRKTPSNCRVCGQSCPTPSHLVIHMRTHTGERPFSCTNCGKTFTRKFDMKRHRRKDGPCQEISREPCYWTKNKPFAKKKNPTEGAQGRRLNSCMELNDLQNATDKVCERLCSHNDRKQSNSDEMHMEKEDQQTASHQEPLHHNLEERNQHHQELSEKAGEQQSISAYESVEEEVEQDQRNYKIGSRQTFTCNVCGKHFDRKSRLEVHAYIHSTHKFHACPVCKKLFKSERHVSMHMVIHSERRIHTCEVCGMQTKTVSTLKQHMFTHTGEKHHTCEICGRQFTWSANLYDHRQSHVRSKEYICDFCNLSFQKRGNLRVHIQNHFGKKPMTCNICHKTFASLHNLRQHLTIHTGEKPFQCEICLKRFRNTALLRVHIPTHSDEQPFSCNLCDGKFKRMENLRNHMLIHEKKKPHSCTVCGKNFRQRGSVKIHMRNVHCAK